MDEVIVDYFDRFGARYDKLDYEFERVAVLAEHETSFGVTLPSDPDAKVYDRRANGYPKDTNAARFEKRYRVIKQIEVDALTSKQLLPQFKNLLWNAVDKYWDEGIWTEEVKNNHDFTEEAVREEISKLVKLTKKGQTKLKYYQDLIGRLQPTSSKTRDEEEGEEDQ
jgi:hypothetical protein